MGILEKLETVSGIEPAPDDALVKVVLLPIRKVWLWIPKNAGGSISRALVKAYRERAAACAIPFEVLWRINPDIRSFEIVAVKRNPFTRVVSCWLNKIMAPFESNEGYFRKHPGLHPGMPFPEFAAWLNSPAGADEHADPHWMSQHLLLRRADLLLPFEDMESVLRTFVLKPHRLTHSNRSEDMAQAVGLAHRSLLDWYDASAIRDIATRYAKDLDRLGYAFPVETADAAG